MEDWERRLYDGYVSRENAFGMAGHRDDALASGRPFALAVIERHVPAQKTLAIADLGCGQGTLLHCLKSLGYTNIRGIDASPEQVRLARQRGLHDVACQDARTFLTDKTSAFDIVFLMDVLEHLDKRDVLDLLGQVRNALTSHGTLILHVPNAEGLFGMRVRYGDLTHRNAFTQQSIAQALHACGFATVQCFEDKPVVHGLKSLLRYVLWQVLTIPFRLLLTAETGTTRHILSQNMTVVCRTTRGAPS